MTFAVQHVFENTDTMTLTGGLLMYTDNSRARLVTIHDAISGQTDYDVPRLGPGRLVNRETVTQFFQGLSSVPQERFVLPENVLAWESSMLCWWRPAGRRIIFFSTQNDALNAISGQEVMHPPLVFRAQPSNLSVWALGQDKRPTEQTELYRAPYFNIYGNGQMCTGSVRLPEQPQPNNIPQWEECFFGSNFAHGNTQALTTHPKGHTGYWKMLSKQNATKQNAMRYLNSGKVTLQQIVTGAIIDE